jgi:Streptomyces sporulation and cell division protein, SsgA
VQIWPSLDIHARAVVVIELMSPHGEALLQAPASEVNEFLQRTFDMVPRGGEDMALDIDATVVQLLGQQHGVE